jgi:membrane-bound ClpP family serine protease
MFWFIVFGIIFLGLLFILAEILFVPGGVLGILGLLVLLFGIYYGYANGGTTEGHIVLGTTFGITMLAIVFAIRSKSWKKISLDTDLKEKFNANSGVQLEKGMKGKAITRLNPMGKARFNTIEAEVISAAGFIDEGAEVEVYKTEGSKIYIKLTKN